MVINTQWCVGPLIMIFYRSDLCYANPLQICKVIVDCNLYIASLKLVRDLFFSRNLSQPV